MQAKGRVAITPRLDGPQKGILDPQDGRVGATCHGLAPPGCGRLPPDADHIRARGFAKADVISGQCEDAPHARLRQKSAVKNVKPPQSFPRGGLGLGARH